MLYTNFPCVWLLYQIKNKSLPEMTRDSQKDMDKHTSSPVISSDEEEEYDFPSNLVINRRKAIITMLFS